MKIILRRFSAVLWLLLVFAALLVPLVSAEETPEIRVPVKITAEGTLPKKEEKYVVRLSADEKTNPMPNTQSGGSFDLTVDGIAEAVFPPIRYDCVGIYTYEIEQNAGGDPDCKYDERRYKMNVSVTNATDGGYDITVLLHEIGKEAKPVTAAFHNVYKSSDATTNPNAPPKTGNDSHIFMWCILLVVSGFGMIGTTVLGRNEKKA